MSRSRALCKLLAIGELTVDEIKAITLWSREALNDVLWYCHDKGLITWRNGINAQASGRYYMVTPKGRAL